MTTKQKPAAEVKRRDVRIEATAEIGKTFSAKAEKVGDDLVTVAHLKFSELSIPREAVDLLIGWPEGMSAQRLYSELGEPLAYFGVDLSASDYTVGGSIRGNAETGEKLVIPPAATLSGVKLALVPLGALLSGELSWKAAGDEVADAEPLLGKRCMASLTIFGPVQVDWVKDAA